MSSDRNKCCAHCYEYFDSSSSVYFYSDSAYCSESHRALAVSSSSHAHRKHVEGALSMAEPKLIDEVHTGVGLRSQLRFWS